MDSDSLREILEDAGLSPYQAKAYVAALDLGTASATELADASEVPDPRIYDVIRELEGRRYIETYENNSLKIRAHSPAEVLEDLQNRADRYEAAAEEIEERWEQPELDSHAASIVKRFETVIDRARMFIDEADHQIRLSASPDQFEVLRPALAAAHDRGVVIHVSLFTYPDEGDRLPPESMLSDACTEARHRSIPSPFVTLVDRTKACFSPNPVQSDEYGVLVDDRIYEYVFHWYFLTCLWELCDVVYSARNEEMPGTYTDIRQFIQDVEPILRDGAVVEVGIEGQRTDTHQHETLQGEVVDVNYEGDGQSPEGIPTLAQLAGQASLILDTGEEDHTVGGWGATLEEFEALKIMTKGIEYPDDIGDSAKEELPQ